MTLIEDPQIIVKIILLSFLIQYDIIKVVIKLIRKSYIIERGLKKYSSNDRRIKNSKIQQ